MRWLRDNGIAVFFGVLCLGSLVGQAFAGQRVFNEDAVQHGGQTVSLVRYLVSSHYGQAVLENWQSEYLQFGLFILATIWLMQKGSPESDVDTDTGTGTERREKIGRYALRSSPAWAKAGGWRTALYSWSLVILMFVIFFASWLGQSFTGWSEFNGEQREHDEPTVAWAQYVRSATFWEDTLQNWQSEFLAVGSFSVFAIFLRARGSAESKSVGAPHDATGDA
jgi:hypothetical protein